MAKLVVTSHNDDDDEEEEEEEEAYRELAPPVVQGAHEFNTFRL